MSHTGDVAVCRAWSRPRPALMRRQGLVLGEGQNADSCTKVVTLGRSSS